MRFTTEQLPVALYQSRTQFLLGTKAKKTENSNIDGITTYWLLT